MSRNKDLSQHIHTESRRRRDVCKRVRVHLINQRVNRHCLSEPTWTRPRPSSGSRIRRLSVSGPARHRLSGSAYNDTSLSRNSGSCPAIYITVYIIFLSIIVFRSTSIHLSIFLPIYVSINL